jgi:hypothetical protein
MLMFSITEWRLYRRHFHQHFHQKNAEQYIPEQTWSTHVFLRQLMENPSDFMAVTRE